MTEVKNPEETHAGLSTTDLAYERTMLAFERTLMAWVRTSLSMISFGFTIYKFFEEMTKTGGATEKLLTPRIVGLIMISFGVIALCLAQLQHRIAVKKLKEHYPGIQKSLSSVIGVMVLLFGLLLFFGALFRQ